ncbi:MAG: hypothetical protein M1822_001971 [Bathelium mastoideum]|nr:MAG: hypothetical protein M1822_001971 [Bathelium mastoideum]
MPHFETISSFPFQPASTTYLPRPSGRPSSSASYTAWAKQAFPPHARPPTPPLDMNTAAHHVVHYAHRAGQTHEDPGYGQRIPPMNYPSSSIAQSSNVNPMSNGRPLTPYSQNKEPARPSEQSSLGKSSTSNAIAPFLQIPRTINSSGGSLSELAAQITCLFWFESSTTLAEIEDARSPITTARPLVQDAIPTTGFRKWVTTILSTTQVAQHVILLALLFVYRLKRSNPTVKGKPGSEYRLLTVALMLGNKFLDDNTYTNKTWAEVSGISVSEVHVMEVEFLSNMRYSLFTSEKQWKEWHVRLGKFAAYVEAALRPHPERAQALPRGPPTPTVLVPPTLPSPPGSNHASPPFPGTNSPHRPAYSKTPPSLYNGPLPELDLRHGKKRSIDESAYEPQPKRLSRHYPQSCLPASTCSPASSMTVTPGTVTSSTPVPRPMTNGTRLELPRLSVPVQNNSSGGAVGARQAHQLPPIQHSGRSTPQSVYPPPVSWPTPSSIPTSSGPPTRPQLFTSGASYDYHSRQQSPYPNSANVSPTSTILPSSASQSQPPTQLSPSYFLFQRNSPYRPVRQVNTLLQHPPSGSVQNAPNIPTESMHYQPLSKSGRERKAGVLPMWDHNTFADPHASGSQGQSWMQLPQPIPQPNFRG